MAKGGMRGSAIKLAMAGGVEYGLQVAMPVILVRHLDAAAFGEYRLLWLLALTVFSIAPCFMPQSMFFFLPRAGTPRERAVVLGNTVLYLTVAGVMGALVTSGWNLWMPDSARQLFHNTHGWSAVFIGMWVLAGLFDVLPTADGHPSWQAKATVSLALVRTALLAGAAILTQDITHVVYAMLLLVGLKLLVMFYYILRGGSTRLALNWSTWRKQLRYAAPFALGTALFLMRMQADQWVVVASTSAAMYAVFSIASVLQPVSTLIRTPVLNAVMVHINTAFAKGDLAQVRSLVAKSNGGAGFLLLPVAGGLFSVAPELVRIVYTDKYSQAAPIMQVYLVGMMLSSFAVGHLLPALNKGRFATLNNAVCLPISVGVSLVGVKYLGILGAALGSVATLAISELWSAGVVATALQTRVGQLLALRTLLPSCLATVAGIAAALLAGQWINAVPWLVLLGKGAVYALVALPVLLLSGGKPYLMNLIGRK